MRKPVLWCAMPWKPKQPCPVPYCNARTDGGPCQRHKRIMRRQYDQKRGSQRERGYTRAWERLRRMMLAEYPVCQKCNREAATEVHHIVAIAVAPDLRLDADNLMCLCKSCHSKETSKRKIGGNLGASGGMSRDGGGGKEK